MPDEPKTEGRKQSISPHSFIKAIRGEGKQPEEENGLKKATMGILVTVVGALLIGLGGNIGTFFVMQYKVDNIDERLTHHVGREGHEVMATKVALLSARVVALEDDVDEQDDDVQESIAAIQADIRTMSNNIASIRGALPSAWTNRESPNRPR